MRDDHQIALKKLKLAPLYQEILDEYMATYYELSAKVERLDRRIEELASESRYLEQTKRLVCFISGGCIPISPIRPVF